jgi:hypothetical protein
VSSCGSYEHFIYGPAREAVDAVASDLTKAGYLVPAAPAVAAYCAETRCPGCSQHWLLNAYGSVTTAASPGGRDDIELACITHGATYDGGGTVIITTPAE